MLEQDYSYEPYAIALPRGDSDLRLVVNRELARLSRSGDISEVMNDWFGALGDPSAVDRHGLSQLDTRIGRGAP